MLSAVAAVLGFHGGLRVVIGPLSEMARHRRPDERMFIVPALRVQEPVAAGSQEMRAVIDQAASHADESLRRACGTCRVCCVLPFVKSDTVTKPSHTPCQHLDGCGRCKVYTVRPHVCRAFECLWRKSQGSVGQMEASLRPDRCGAMLVHDTTGGDPDVVELHTDPSSEVSLRMRRYLAQQEKRGRRVRQITHYVGEHGA